MRVRSRSARRCNWPMSTSARDTLDGEKNVWEEISGGEETLILGERQQQLARLCLQLQLPRLGPAEESGDRSRAESATACTWRRC